MNLINNLILIFLFSGRLIALEGFIYSLIIVYIFRKYINDPIPVSIFISLIWLFFCSRVGPLLALLILSPLKDVLNENMEQAVMFLFSILGTGLFMLAIQKNSAIKLTENRFILLTLFILPTIISIVLSSVLHIHGKSFDAQQHTNDVTIFGGSLIWQVIMFFHLKNRTRNLPPTRPIKLKPVNK